MINEVAITGPSLQMGVLSFGTPGISGCHVLQGILEGTLQMTYMDTEMLLERLDMNPLVRM